MSSSGRNVGTVHRHVRRAPGESVSLPSGQPIIPYPKPQTTASRQDIERPVYEQDGRGGSEHYARPSGISLSATQATQTNKPQFWRIRNIRSSEVDDAQKWVRETSQFGSSLAKDGEDSYCATVTSVNCKPPLDRAHWSVDKEFMGITPLCDCDDAEVDLVAVTGLAGHALGSFRSSSGAFVWLRDALPKDVPKVRVLTYGYDTALVKNQSKESLYHLASTFLDRLDSFRRATRTQQRPVCFLGHSLGGVVIKEALTISHMANRSPRDWTRNLDDCGVALYTCGLVLFGVPNLGLQHRQLLTMVKGQRNKNFVQSLLVNEDNEPSTYLAELTRKFSQLCSAQEPRFGIYSYFETEASPTETGPGTFDMSDPVRNQLKNWLNPPDPTLNHRRSLKLRNRETGTWLLEGDIYNEWKIGMPSFLWLYGSAGSGKSILSSGIINDLQTYCKDEPERALAYFYFDFNDTIKQDPMNMIKSLLYQLLEQGVRIPQSLQSAHVSCNNGQRSASSAQLLDALHETLKTCPASYIVLDALDECTARVDLLDMLEEIHGWKILTLHVIATSRKEVEIEAQMEKLTTGRGRICLESDVVNQDIRTYVQTRLMHEESFRRWQKVPAVRNEIEVTLAQKAHGIVRAALNDLPATLNDTYARIIEDIDQGGYGDDALKILRWLVYAAEPLTTKQVLEVTGIYLGTQPHFDPEERYVDAFDISRVCSSLISIVEIEGDDSEDKENSEDMADAEVEDDADIDDEQDVEDKNAMKAEDRGYVVDNGGEDDDKSERDSKEEESAAHEAVEGEESVEDEEYPQRYVQLAHFSVKEYLISRHSLRPGFGKYSLQDSQECHDILGRCCLVYLLRFETESPFDKNYDITFPLARYAARYWGFYHVRALEMVSQQLHRLMSRLLTRDSGAYAAWTRLHDPFETDEFSDPPDFPLPSPTTQYPLCAATGTGAKHVAQIALEALSIDGNARRVECTDALELAVALGYADIVVMLADTGADVNALTGIRGNLLSLAIESKHRHIVEVLIDKGANVNAVIRGMWRGCTALHVASLQNISPATMVDLLLVKGADINAISRERGTALAAASYVDRMDVAVLLLDRGADIDLEGGEWGTPLQAASSQGHSNVVRLLLDKGANVHAQGGRYGSALYLALHGVHRDEEHTRHGRDEVSKLLRAAGPSSNLRSMIARAPRVRSAFERRMCRFKRPRVNRSLLSTLACSYYRSVPGRHG
ncbi:hypothetical protein LTR17_001442 [Elasticomyces elasticus]|nr:hypothetical protein LTR17_001442 [Elasticomyces elasticus]